MKLVFNFNQSGVIPYRKKNDDMEILLITSMKKKRWIVPKGFIEFNLSAFESAKKEAFEEAGVFGANETIELGSFDVFKKSGNTHIKIYSMEVVNIIDDYPDKNLRKRKWFTVKEAAESVSKPELSEMILKLKEKIRT